MTKSSSGINITPLIDILLVLLIVFMVITPTTSHGLEAELPRPRPATTPLLAVDSSVVITVAADGSLAINRDPVTKSQLPTRLKLHRAVFVQGAPDADYERVVEIIDLARGAGVAQIGLMPR